MTICAPWRAMAIAAALPMPLPPPVIQMMFEVFMGEA
jgi:hypothetical protein